MNIKRSVNAVKSPKIKKADRDNSIYLKFNTTSETI